MSGKNKNNAAAAAAATPGVEGIAAFDIGDSSGRVAVYSLDRPNVVANPGGERETPTVVAFTDTECLTGLPARNQAHRNQANTLTGFFGLLGLAPGSKAYEAAVAAASIKPNAEGSFEVTHLKAPAKFTPVDLLGKVIGSLRNTAADFIGAGAKVTSAVVVIPATYAQAQREALAAAFASQGIMVRQFIESPIAAVMSMDLSRPVAGKKRRVMVIDVGLCTEISVVGVEGGIMTLESTRSKDVLGGRQFDDALVAHFVDEFKRKTRLDVSESRKALANLTEAARTAKVSLSTSQTATVNVEALYEGLDFNSTITRGRFDNLIAPINQRITAAIDE